MKKLSLVVAIICSAVIANAQGFHIGAKAGANIGKLEGQSFKQGYSLGYQLGGFLQLNLSKSIGLQPEVLFSQTNTTFENSTSATYANAFNGQKKDLKYLSIPVLLAINPGKFVTIQLGPQYSILLNNHETVYSNGQQAFKSGDLSAVAGLQLNFSALHLYGRYNVGLSNINDVANSDKWKNQQIQIGLGLKLL